MGNGSPGGIPTIEVAPHQNGNSLPNETAPKRKYSRNGCTQCKKRRIKCDENKPRCWQCSRLNRECIYILNKKNKPRAPRKHKANKQTRPEFSPQQQYTQRDASISEPLSINNNFGFTFNDTNLLYNDLNELVNWRLEEALTPNLKTYIEGSSNPFNAELQDSSIPITLDRNEIIFNNPITNFDLGVPHNKYLSGFYHQFCTLICPFTPNPGQNPVRDVLLHYAYRETYLMYAILACGARIIHHETTSLEDDQAYCSYLSSCLSILGEVMQNEKKSSNVEPLLLTILLLTSDAASSKSMKWRAHLKGAKELLTKTNIQSDTLNFCRNWLITYEVLAGISNPYGGIFHTDKELDKVIGNDELYLTSLKRLRMLDPSGFNYLGGHVIALDLAFRDIIKILNKIRRAKALKNLDKDSTDYLSSTFDPKVLSLNEVTDIIVLIKNCENASILDKSGELSEKHPVHPLNNQLSKSFNAVETLRLPQGKEVTYSWFDVSNQCHVIAATAVLLVRVLGTPKDSVLVQDLVKKGLNFLEFLKVVDTYDNVHMAHLHMMADAIGKLCIDFEDQSLIEKYLTILHEKFGLASAGHNVNKLRKIWSGETLNEDEEDVLTW